MINPYREAAPWARAITLVLLGVVILYGLGRWDSSIDRRLQELKAETAAVLDLIEARRAWVDSVRALEDSLGAADAALALQERRTRATLRELAARDTAVVEWAESSPVDSLLPLLRMRPLQLDTTTWYATTEAGVRLLARGMLRVPVLDRRVEELGSLAATRLSRIETLTTLGLASRVRADSLQADLDRAVPVMEAWQKHSGCKILGFIKCPSRTTALVIGVLAGGTAAYIGSKR